MAARMVSLLCGCVAAWLSSVNWLRAWITWVCLGLFGNVYMKESVLIRSQASRQAAVEVMGACFCSILAACCPGVMV